jgi:molybdopterin molybdotransferase
MPLNHQKAMCSPPFEEAVRLILDAVSPQASESVPLLDSLRRVSAVEVLAPWSTPRYDNSAMDGFAVRAADCVSGAALPIRGYVPAGAMPTPAVGPGCAIKIMTGAPIPTGCDAVVPFEAAEEVDGAVRPKKPVAPRQHVRFTGEDIAAGDAILPRGHIVRPVDIGVLASFGQKIVVVYKQPKVAVLSTGDELVESAEDLAPGKVLDSNRWAIAAAVRDCGAIPVVLGIARDDAESHRKKLEEGLRADVLISTAGVSAGDRDLVRNILAELDVRPVFRGVRVKPGSPTCFGLHGSTQVFSLPGNPVASLIAFEEFVKPALLKMMGHQRVLNPFLPAILASHVRKSAGNAKLLRVTLEQREGVLWAWSAGKQDTGMQKTLLRADALALLPEDRVSFATGEIISVQMLNAAMAEEWEVVIRCAAPNSTGGAVNTGAARSEMTTAVKIDCA